MRTVNVHPVSAQYYELSCGCTAKTQGVYSRRHNTVICPVHLYRVFIIEIIKERQDA